MSLWLSKASLSQNEDLKVYIIHLHYKLNDIELNEIFTLSFI